MLNKYLLLHGILAGVIAVTYGSIGRADAALEFDHVEETSVFFKTPDGKLSKPLKTTLFELKYLGVLGGGLGNPFFVFSGRPCQSCPEDKMIYALHPPDEEVIGFVYPGKIVDSKKNTVVHQSRMFFGKCMEGKPEGFVTFQREQVDRRGQQSSVFTAFIEGSGFDEKLVVRHLPRIERTLRLAKLKNKQCWEIEGRNRMSLPKGWPTRVAEESPDDDEPPAK